MKSWTQNLKRLQQQAQGAASGQPGRTLLEIVGKERLVIERHRGIQCYGTEEILVRTSFGQLRISGSGLSLCCMSREQLCVTGRIDLIELIGRGGNGSVE